jgi:hypothetical protein
MLDERLALVLGAIAVLGEERGADSRLGRDGGDAVAHRLRD